ncbi:cytochrome P450 alkane hydroxylase-like protein [Setomelanomma holmii]|uniref:Cytochrome P450 alkane hydroxylase-like protein n=1 Tax=Setomelanomma holmii TaxID=210430 RepID=A0A9P4HMA5_9PLEO|nr:cytochrome P450 alkane hydroxylase-like protein [Setomelanomma holmii]
MAIFTFTNIAISLVSLYVARRMYWEAIIGSRRRAFAKEKGTLPCTPRPTPLPSYIPTFGLDFVISNFRVYREKRLLEHWQQYLIKANAHTVVSNVVGQQLFITDDAENVRAILATNFENWSLGQERIKQMSDYLGHGVFTNEGAAWKHSREMLRPCFERHQVADTSLFAKHMDRLIAVLPTDGTAVDLQPLFHELTLDIATKFMFGRSTDSLKREEKTKEVADFVEAFEYCADPFLSENFEKYGYLGLFLPDKKRKRGAQTIKDFADKIIDEELSSKHPTPPSKQTRYIFFDEILSQTTNRTIIRSELLNILLAGRDTTAALLSNVMWELPCHPAILSCLRAEIVEHVGDEVPTYEQLKELKYLRAIINESQRLYPIVPSNSRQALHDTNLPRGGGPDGSAPIFVPKGAYVAYHTYAMHRRTDIYGSDADEFRPERWLEQGFRPGWAYIPFSGGPMVCIGQNFALTEAMFVVVRLLQCFEVDGRDEGIWREKLTITCTGAGGCKLGLRRRVM